jgi:hypothetical protein
MVPTDRQLVDSLMAAILSTSQLIELILEEEIQRVYLEPVANIARIKALDKVRRDFHLRALIMEYVLKERL